MKSISRTRVSRTRASRILRAVVAVALFGAGAGLLFASSASGPRIASAASSTPGPAGPAPDSELAPYRTELIALAFESASSLPVEPHLKSRSRAQARVVRVCLELDRPDLALAYIPRIDNWRRGAAYADLALYRARRGDRSPEVHALLGKAERIAHDPSMDPGQQAWRRDRVKVKIAQAMFALGRLERAAELEAGVVESETGRVALVRVESLDGDGAFRAELARLDEVLATGDLDQVRNALEVCLGALRRFYGDRARRAEVETRIRTAGDKLPADIRIEMIRRAAVIALEHDDRRNALDLADRAEAIAARGRWLPEHAIPMLARLAALRHRAGDRARARRDLDAALARFRADREKIQNFERAGVVRPLAEAYRAMEDHAGARELYQLAVTEGAVNPNARPRAEDLTDTCLSLAAHAVEPDEALWRRLREVRAGLDHPW